MPRVDCVVETEIKRTGRAAQVEGIFDVPKQTKQRLEWHGDVPLDERAWNVGLIVGPSGAGKSTVARQLFFGLVDVPLEWSGDGVINDFPAAMSVEDVAGICAAVGFNTIPAWLRPFHLLSNGEQFRVALARRMAESGGLTVVDEFTSVVDRQVAKIAANAAQKHVRKRGVQFVAVTCHEDVEPWLLPDWVLRLPEFQFGWRSLQRRPPIECEIRRVEWKLWRRFAPYHYLTAELHRAAWCYALFVDGRAVVFCGVLHRPTGWERRKHGSHARQIRGVSRVVTLPDYQGLGLAFVLLDTLGAAYRATGFRFRNYPAHPPFVRAHVRNSTKWRCDKLPGQFSTRANLGGKMGGRPCAVFEYIGPPMSSAIEARRLLDGTKDADGATGRL